MTFPASLGDFELREKSFRFFFHLARVFRPILLERQRFSVNYIGYQRIIEGILSLENACHLAFRLMWMGSTIGRIQEIRHFPRSKKRYAFFVLYCCAMGLNELIEDILTLFRLKVVRTKEDTLEKVERLNHRTWFAAVVLRALSLSRGNFFDALSSSGQLLIDFGLAFRDAFKIPFPCESKKIDDLIYDALAALSALFALKRIYLQVR